MKVRNYIYAAGLTIIALLSCNKDDDGGDVVVIPPRDRAEQQQTDDAKLKAYFDTHFYTDVEVDLNNDGQIEYSTREFDSFAGDNADKLSISKTGLLQTKVIEREGVKYNLYILKIAGGSAEKGKPTFADSTLITYNGTELYKEEKFDERVTPVWFDQTAVIEGWREALVDYSEASGFVENTDGTVKYNDDYGNLTVFIPSGLGYFDRPPTGISAYVPLIFNIQLYAVNQSDHDADGIPSYLDDIDNDRFLVQDGDDNSDGDSAPNYSDADDDNDGTPTKNEISVVDANNDGIITSDEITFYDDDGDGVHNHLDADDKDVKSE